MSFTAQCPYCGAKYPDVEDERRGRRARCKRCSQSFLALPPDSRTDEARERAKRLKVPFVRVAAIIIDPFLSDRFPRDLLVKHRAIPIGHHGKDLLVAMADPADVFAADELREAVPGIQLALGLPDEVQEALDKLPPPAATADEATAASLAAAQGNKLAAKALTELQQQDAAAPATSPAPPVGPAPPAGAPATAGGAAAQAQDVSPAKAALERVLQQAVEQRNHELRVFEREGRSVVQGRDSKGMLQTLMADPKVPYHHLMARLKDAAGCDPARRGEEQTGSIPLRVGTRAFEFYVRILPAGDQERAQLRLLDPATARQRRAAERRQKIEQAILQLASRDWPPAGSGVDPSGAREFVLGVDPGDPAAQLALGIVEKAMDQSVQDVVLEPHPTGLRVLGRAGADHFDTLMTIPEYAQASLFVRLRNMAKMEAETSATRFGVFYVLREGGHACEVRVAMLPTEEGTQALMRLVKHS